MFRRAPPDSEVARGATSEARNPRRFVKRRLSRQGRRSPCPRANCRRPFSRTRRVVRPPPARSGRSRLAAAGYGTSCRDVWVRLRPKERTLVFRRKKLQRSLLAAALAAVVTGAVGLAVTPAVVSAQTVGSYGGSASADLVRVNPSTPRPHVRHETLPRKCSRRAARGSGSGEFSRTFRAAQRRASTSFRGRRSTPGSRHRAPRRCAARLRSRSGPGPCRRGTARRRRRCRGGCQGRPSRPW